MGSENAKAVAQEVIEHVRKGTKVNLGKIVKKHGYSDSVSKHPDKVTQTKSYQDETQPIIQAMIQEREGH